MKSINSKEKIIEDYEKIVKFVIKNMKLGHMFDELYDIGIIGFVNGINTYDGNKGFKYTTYLYECVKNEILKYLQYQNTEKRKAIVISLNMMIGENTELQDVIGYDTDYLEDNYNDELIDTINDRISFMTKKEQIVFNHLYGLNGYKEMTSGEIQKKYGFSRQSIYQIKKICINKLRYILYKYQKGETQYTKEKSVKTEFKRIIDEYNQIH